MEEKEKEETLSGLSGVNYDTINKRDKFKICTLVSI